MKALQLKPNAPRPGTTAIMQAPIDPSAFRPLEAETEWSPPVDVKELPAAYVIYADLPGFRPSQITISVDAEFVSISGERIVSTEFGRSLLSERPCGLFVRRFSLPEDALCREMEATLNDGLLEVRIPRAGAERPSEETELH